MGVLMVGHQGPPGERATQVWAGPGEEAPEIFGIVPNGSR